MIMYVFCGDEPGKERVGMSLASVFVLVCC